MPKMSIDYSDFLSAKRRSVGDLGVSVSDIDMHPSLFDFQKSIVEWCAMKGRAAIFADCGLGKSRMQIEWARLVGRRSLIIAPLSVARQTVREATEIGVDLRYVRDNDAVTSDGLFITNYEILDHFDTDQFDAVVLDESSVLKNVDGRTRQTITSAFHSTPMRLACTATPAPNDVAELANHAEFLGVMPRNEMLAAYFTHDDDGWRLKGHAADPMYEWMASWAVAIRRPSDLGYSNEGYDLPPLNIESHIVRADVESPGQLFATDLGGVGGRAQVRRATLAARSNRAIELASDNGQWIIWCGLNDEAETVARGLAGAVNVEGSWGADQKADAFERFQDGEIRVLVTKPAIAGFGMNFQNCHRMAFVGLSDSYESYYQCIRRCYRFGQKNPVTAHVILSDLESQIAENVRRKESESQHVTDRLISHMHRQFTRETV